MIKSGLGQKEKLKALRFFVANYDQSTLSRKLCEIAHIEKQKNILEQSGLKAPCEWLTMHSTSDQQRQHENRPPDEYLPYAKHIDAMRVAVCYTGNFKIILDAELKYHHLNAVLYYWKEGDSVLCLTNEDINRRSGCFMFNGTSDDKYWVYQGREQNGDYIFKYTSDYYRNSLNGCDDEYL